MDFIHYDFHLEKGDIVHVEIDHQANVMLLDEPNFQNYRSRRGFQYIGGNYDISPINLAAPSDGYWHLVIDLGGYAGTIQHSARILKR